MAPPRLHLSAHIAERTFKLGQSRNIDRSLRSSLQVPCWHGEVALDTIQFTDHGYVIYDSESHLSLALMVVFFCPPPGLNLIKSRLVNYRMDFRGLFISHGKGSVRFGATAALGMYGAQAIRRSGSMSRK